MLDVSGYYGDGYAEQAAAAIMGCRGLMIFIGLNIALTFHCHFMQQATLYLTAHLSSWECITF